MRLAEPVEFGYFWIIRGIFPIFVSVCCCLVLVSIILWALHKMVSAFVEPNVESNLFVCPIFLEVVLSYSILQCCARNSVNLDVLVKQLER